MEFVRINISNVKWLNAHQIIIINIKITPNIQSDHSALPHQHAENAIIFRSFSQFFSLLLLFLPIKCC